MAEVNITLHCMNGFTLFTKGENLIVTTKRAEEIFPISKIQSFILKEPRTLSPGSILFRTAQSSSAGINIGFGIGVALGAEKTFFFQKSDFETAKNLRDYISDYGKKSSGEVTNGKTVVSVVDEIRGLRDLLDEGILTQDEFDAKKKQLLSL
ncbi:MAG: hypothetical protein K0R50_446 [Eubacterium sp.]|nr:hypothetical protein [Eubacterium sp.]